MAIAQKFEIEEEDFPKFRKRKQGDNVTPYAKIRPTTLLDPKVVERQLTWVAPGKCDRLGACCIRIPLELSPRQLRESYNNWLNYRDNITPLTMGLKSDNLRVHKDIHLIYPMLVGRCLGKIPTPPKEEWDEKKEEKYILGKSENESVTISNFAGRYVYGPCKNFQFSKIGLAECTINDHKPWMCSSYPNGGAGTFKGCGYNLSLELGITIADLSKDKLESLDPDEL